MGVQTPFVSLRALRLALMLAGAVVPGVASAESIGDALSNAYRTSSKLDAARATLRATDEEVSRANSGYRPVISGTADTGFQDQISKSPFTGTTTAARGVVTVLLSPR